MKHLQIITAVMLFALLAGCQSTPRDTTPALYTLMTDRDIKLADETLQQTLETSPSARGGMWYNTSSGNSGSVLPLRTYKTMAGYYCRDYKEELQVAEQRTAYFDTACRNEEGKWYPI